MKCFLLLTLLFVTAHGQYEGAGPVRPTSGIVEQMNCGVFIRLYA